MLQMHHKSFAPLLRCTLIAGHLCEMYQDKAFKALSSSEMSLIQYRKDITKRALGVQFRDIYAIRLRVPARDILKEHTSGSIFCS